MKINILGVPYEIKFLSEEEDFRLENADGYTDFYSRLIVINNSNTGTIHDIEAYRKKVLRHEIVHAFMYESGLAENSHKSNHVSDDEELIDWIAIQGEKIHEAWKEVDALSVVAKNG